jgi:hypothetical protein
VDWEAAINYPPGIVYYFIIFPLSYLLSMWGKTEKLPRKGDFSPRIEARGRNEITSMTLHAFLSQVGFKF